MLSYSGKWNTINDRRNEKRKSFTTAFKLEKVLQFKRQQVRWICWGLFSEYNGLTLFQVNLFHSDASVYNHPLYIEKQHGQLVTQESFTIDKRNSVTCSNEYCSLENLPQNSYELEALLLNTPSVIMDEKGFTIRDRIKHLMLDKWKLSECSCGEGTKILSSCVITRTPLLLYISCAEILSSRDDPIIDPSITIMGFNYDLVAVGYGDGTYFTGTFSCGGAAYEYDGCRNCGLCRLMNSEGSPFVFEPKAGSYSYKRTPTILWYKRGYVEIFWFAPEDYYSSIHLFILMIITLSILIIYRTNYSKFQPS